MFEIAERGTRRGSGFVSLKQILPKTIDRIDFLSHSTSDITGVPTGFEELDDLTAGLQPSDLIVIAGRPSMGAWVNYGLGCESQNLPGFVVMLDRTGGPISGARNRIINGGMAVDQRNAGASQTFTAAAALAYSVDRWYGYCTGANVTGQRVQGATVGQFYYRFTGAASVTAIGFGQRIEQLNSADLAGTTATLSVDLANSLLTTVTWTAYYATTADTFGTLASPTRTQIATGTFTVTSTVTRYNTNISVPAAATTGIEIVFTVGAQTSGTWTIGNVQLEAGSVATPFERRSYGHEFALSERYYQKLYVGITLPGATNTSNYTFTVPFRVFPRPVSTSNVSFSSISYANASSLTCASVSSYGFQLLWIATTNGFAGINYAEAVISVEL